MQNALHSLLGTRGDLSLRDANLAPLLAEKGRWKYIDIILLSSQEMRWSAWNYMHFPSKLCSIMVIEFPE